ncbi:alpha/beta hydrolase [Myxococcota bacterium]|nr:alpha/beta hydrolase [Myxococcota bacterium]MBU1534822.1 alpha/beta hydrolase [Myxococcota bacterium]
MTQREPYCETEFRGIIYGSFVVPASDGTPIAVKRTGNLSRPAVIVANGVGVPWFGMHEIMAQLARHFCVYTWDYRGIGESEPVIRQDFSIERHAKDGLSVANWFGLEQYSLVGWSMGVPVLLEMYRLDPGAATKLAFLYGAPGLPYVASMGRIGDRIFRSVLNGALKHRLVPVLLKKTMYRYFEPFVKFLSVSGFTSSKVDPEIIRKNVRAVLDENTLYYGTTLLELGRHNGWDVLGSISVPALVVAGGKDWVTPEATMRKMAGAISGATYLVHPNASHFGVIEEREALWEPLLRLLMK